MSVCTIIYNYFHSADNSNQSDWCCFVKTDSSVYLNFNNINTAIIHFAVLTIYKLNAFERIIRFFRRHLILLTVRVENMLSIGLDEYKLKQ